MLVRETSGREAATIHRATSAMMMSMTGRLESINTSRGGVPKLPLLEELVTTRGLSGDRQNNVESHGGSNRAVVIFSLEVIRALQREGHPIDVGTTGENFTISGIDWQDVVPEGELQIGSVLVAVTTYAGPCSKIRRSFRGDDFSRISQKLHPGWSRVCARVMREGVVQVGDPVVWSASPSQSQPRV